MAEIEYIERVPRRPDFCGNPLCPICFQPVLIDDQRAPTFEECMRGIYGAGPKPQTLEEYEFGHVAAHQTRVEWDSRPAGEFFHQADRERMTQMQIDDLLKRAKKAAEAPKPLNRINLDDMASAAEAAKSKNPQPAKVPVPQTAPPVPAYVTSNPTGYSLSQQDALNAYNTVANRGLLYGGLANPLPPGGSILGLLGL